MHKSTILFAGFSIVLAVVVGVITWQVLQHEPIEEESLMGGAHVQLSIPDAPSSTINHSLSAGSALLYDTQTNTILFEHNGFERRPIASITKLMTAMVALDHGIPWDKEVKILPEDHAIGGRLLLHADEYVTMRDLFVASLLGSANNATKAYVRELGIPIDEFIREMNRKAIALGFDQTEFTDVTGLHTTNLSTAYEVALLAQLAFSEYPEISETTSKQEYTFIVGGSAREHTIKNTSKFVSQWEEQVTGSKTGFLNDARYCLVTQGAGKYAHRISVILNSPSDAEHIADTKKLLYMDIP